jgi:hypothetical protein
MPQRESLHAAFYVLLSRVRPHGGSSGRRPRPGEQPRTYHPVLHCVRREPPRRSDDRRNLERSNRQPPHEEHAPRVIEMLPFIKYIWPLWIGLILQFFTSVAGEFVFGENRAFADWVFGRNCDGIASWSPSLHSDCLFSSMGILVVDGAPEILGAIRFHGAFPRASISNVTGR